MSTATATTPEAHLDCLQETLRPLYQQLGAHPLYRSFRSIEDVRLFQESHIFAVWDFMSLLKALQRGLTCVEIPWLPTANAGTRRLVNEIVFGEESDMYEGEALSHYELYLRSMEASGASTAAMLAVAEQLRHGQPIEQVLANVAVPEPARHFVQSTFAVIGSGGLHEIAAAFTFGREDLIPEMFRGFLREEDERLSGRLAIFRWYLDRHIEVDGDEHGPMALRMVTELCGNDPARWDEAQRAAVTALEARLAFWDGILQQIEARRTAS